MDAAAPTLALRLRAHGLSGARAGGVEAVCERMIGIQAQDLALARPAFRPRCPRGVVAADVDAALRAGALVWTWAMRGTLHLVRADDAAWLVGLLGPIFAARGRPRRLALGLDDAFCERALTVIGEELRARGPQTRAALATRAGIDATGQAPAHLLAFAALRGVVRRVPSVAGERSPTFALLSAPGAVLDEDTALARLARRYLAGYGPAVAEDLAAWSGIGRLRARRAFALIAGELREARGGGLMLKTASVRVPARATPHVRLLGHFDPYLVGYASRDPVLDSRFAKRIQAGGGFIAPAILVDGRVAGTWRRDAQDWLAPFEPLPAAVLAAAARERADVERFLAAAV